MLTLGYQAYLFSQVFEIQILEVKAFITIMKPIVVCALFSRT